MDTRLLPDGFLAAYHEAFGADPPSSFMDVYETLAEALYWGAGRGEEVASVRRGRGGSDYFFADTRLLPIKIRVDKVLAQAAAALRRSTFRGEEESGPDARGSR